MKEWTGIVCICLVCMGCVLISGCASDESASPEAGTTAATAGPTAGESPAGESAEVIHYTGLLTYLPPESSWVGEEPTGASAAVDGEDWSWAARSYHPAGQEETTATVIIQDTVGMDVGYREAWETFFVMDTPEFSWQRTTVEGYPAWEFHDKIDDNWAQYVLIEDRIIVFIEVENGKQAHLTVFNNNIDYRGLAALV
ncbi:MAG: hypothetical protein ACP5C4_05325 [Methanomicrobiales archaeon]